jgi:hypothetical protein
MISTPTNHPSEYVKPNSPILSSDEISLSATLHLKGKVALGMPYAAIPLVTNWLLNQSSNTSSCGASCTARPAQKSWKAGLLSSFNPTRTGMSFEIASAMTVRNPRPCASCFSAEHRNCVRSCARCVLDGHVQRTCNPLGTFDDMDRPRRCADLICSLAKQRQPPFEMRPCHR